MPSESGTLSPELKKTPWFPKHVKPVRPGFYENLFFETSTTYRFFDGKNWHYGNSDLKSASKYTDVIKDNHKRPWRGLASDPSQP